MYLLFFSIAIIAIYFFHRLRFLISYNKKETKSLKCLKELISNWNKEDTLRNNHWMIYDTLEKRAKEGDDFLFKVWREFHESLVLKEDGVENTLDSHHFFHADILSPNVFSKEGLKITPNVLVGIGVLFTFLGLVIGLYDLNVTNSDPSSLQKGIETIVNGARLAFYSSIAGIATSVFFLLFHSFCKSKLKNTILYIQNEINFRYPKTNPEKSLAFIRDYSKEQTDILGALSDTIGDKLQEVVRGIRQDLKGEIVGMTQSVNTFMGNLQHNAMNQAESSMEIIVEKFIEKLGGSIKEQQKVINDANIAIREMLTDFNNQFLTQVDGLKELIENLNESYHVVEEKLVGRFSNTVEKLERGINEFLNYQKIIETQLSHQDGLFSNIHGAVMKFREATESFVTTYQNMQENYNQTVTNLSKVFDQLEEITNANAKVSNEMSDLIETFKSPINQLRNEYELMRSKIDEQFQKMSSSMNNVLNSYFSQVETQTAERMNQWNKETYEFSSAMLGAVKELNSSIDTFKDNKIEDYEKSVEIQKNSLEKMNQWNEESRVLVSNMEKFSIDLASISESLLNRVNLLNNIIEKSNQESNNKTTSINKK
ncbi:MAG: anti-phage ZorAB system protein ZorA [Flavobacteriaceae bacterium]|nr:anti-phage ZorAB system protein ZorA [Flavobacteriaceae bacterium]